MSLVHLNSCHPPGASAVAGSVAGSRQRKTSRAGKKLVSKPQSLDNLVSRLGFEPRTRGSKVSPVGVPPDATECVSRGWQRGWQVPPLLTRRWPPRPAPRSDPRPLRAAAGTSSSPSGWSGPGVLSLVRGPVGLASGWRPCDTVTRPQLTSDRRIRIVTIQRSCAHLPLLVGPRHVTCDVEGLCRACSLDAGGRGLVARA